MFQLSEYGPDRLRDERWLAAISDVRSLNFDCFRAQNPVRGKECSDCGCKGKLEILLLDWFASYRFLEFLDLLPMYYLFIKQQPKQQKGTPSTLLLPP